MSHLPFNVYYRERGKSKKVMYAKFWSRVDAINFAYDCSKGRHGHEPNVTMLVMEYGKVVWKYIQGVKQ